MPRPKTKVELLDVGKEHYEKLQELIRSMSEKVKESEFNFEDRDRLVRDVITHLYEWHILAIKWIESNKQGIKRQFLKEGYNFKTYPKMNIEFFEKHQTTSLDDALKMLAQSHMEITNLIKGFSNEELFTKKYFDWTGSTSLGSYCVSSTSSHYDWAIKKLKTHIKTTK